MYHFCTLFDRNYLFKGLSLYYSLERNCREFILHILCMDDVTRDVLRKLDLPHARLISLDEFEDQELQRAKTTRSAVEYFWTCTPSLPLYVLNANAQVDLITYLDADLYFFSDPSPVFEEFGDRSIMIIEHRFPDHMKHLEVNGKYNVQMMIFRRDGNGLRALNWWRERCLEWCFYRLEDGKLGDQKYLDDWTERFSGVHVLRHLGAGVAPWNVSQYEITERDGTLWVNEYPLIFYHFHQFRILASKKYFVASELYFKHKSAPKAIYDQYIQEIERAIFLVQERSPGFAFGIEGAANESIIRLKDIMRRAVPVPIKNYLKRHI